MENKNLLSIETLQVGAHSKAINDEMNRMLSAHAAITGIVKEISEVWKGNSGKKFNENMRKYLKTLNSSIDYLETYSKYLIDAIELYQDKDEYFKRKIEEASTNLAEPNSAMVQPSPSVSNQIEKGGADGKTYSSREAAINNAINQGFSRDDASKLVDEHILLGKLKIDPNVNLAL